MLAAVHPTWTRHPMSITLAGDPYYAVNIIFYYTVNNILDETPLSTLVFLKAYSGPIRI